MNVETPTLPLDHDLAAAAFIYWARLRRFLWAVSYATGFLLVIYGFRLLQRTMVGTAPPTFTHILIGFGLLTAPFMILPVRLALIRRSERKHKEWVEENANRVRSEMMMQLEQRAMKERFGDGILLGGVCVETNYAVSQSSSLFGTACKIEVYGRLLIGGVPISDWQVRTVDTGTVSHRSLLGALADVDPLLNVVRIS